MYAPSGSERATKGDSRNAKRRYPFNIFSSHEITPKKIYAALQG